MGYSDPMGGMERGGNPAVASPYTVTPSATTVAAGGDITITITGATFRGLLAYGVQSGTTTKAGTFTPGTGYKLQTASTGTYPCDGNELTHDSAADKASGATFVWTAPSTAGTYDATGIIASGSTSLTDGRTVGYWQWTLANIEVTAAPTPAPTSAPAPAPTSAPAPTPAPTPAPVGLFEQYDVSCTTLLTSTSFTSGECADYDLAGAASSILVNCPNATRLAAGALVQYTSYSGSGCAGTGVPGSISNNACITGRKIECNLSAGNALSVSFGIFALALLAFFQNL